MTHSDPCFYILASSPDHYLVIKNQQNFELVLTCMTECKLVTNFVLEHILDLATDNSGVILVYNHIKNANMLVDYYPINKMLS